MNNLETLINLICSNPDNIELHYTKVNGRSRLVVNGEELLLQTFDDSRIKQIISNYKESIELLDDCVFIETMDEIAKEININALDCALKQEHFTEEEAADIENCLGYITAVIHEKLVDKIQSSIELLEKF